jgi:hypothetical protein
MAIPEAKFAPLITAWSQGVYFTAFGVWPLAHIRSFQAVTGPKTDHLATGSESDHWLVYTVGALIVVIGVVLLLAAWRQQISIEVIVLGMASAATLAAIDVLFVLRNTIAPIYLADAAVELLLFAGWSAGLIMSPPRIPSPEARS